MTAPHLLARRLLRARRARHLSLRALATRAGLAHTTLWQWEHGVCEPTLAALRRVAAALELPLADLVEGRHEADADAPPR